MKRLLTLLGLVLVGSSFAQTNISNPGFESWSNVKVIDSLEQWFTSSSENVAQGIPVLNTASSANAYDGNLALRLETVISYDIFTGDIDTSFGYAVLGNPPGATFGPYVYTDTVDNFTGFYKCNLAANDTAIIMVELYKAGATYATGYMPVYGSQATWMQFNVPILNGGTDAPDSLFVGFASTNPFGTPTTQDGGWLEVDSVGFEYLAGSTVPATLPNNSFENFYTEVVQQADNWWSMDPHLYPSVGSAYVTQSTNSNSGSYSIEITTTAFNNFAGIPSLATNGWYDQFNDEFYGGDAYIAQPDSLVGMYQYSTLLTDSAWVGITMWNQTTGVLVDTFTALLPAGSWTPFSIGLDLFEAPDSMKIILYSGEELGSELLVDDLDFVGGDLNVETVTTSNEWSFYPNPANENVTILFQEADQITVIDVTGKIIYVDNIKGQNTAVLGTSEWNNGIYFIQVESNGEKSTKKLFVRH